MRRKCPLKYIVKVAIELFKNFSDFFNDLTVNFNLLTTNINHLTLTSK